MQRELYLLTEYPVVPRIDKVVLDGQERLAVTVLIRFDFQLVHQHHVLAKRAHLTQAAATRPEFEADNLEQMAIS